MCVSQLYSFFNILLWNCGHILLRTLLIGCNLNDYHRAHYGLRRKSRHSRILSLACVSPRPRPAERWPAAVWLPSVFAAGRGVCWSSLNSAERGRLWNAVTLLTKDNSSQHPEVRNQIRYLVLDGIQFSIITIEVSCKYSHWLIRKMNYLIV